MNKRGRLESMVWTATPQHPVGEAKQLVVDHRKQPVRSGGVPSDELPQRQVYRLSAADLSRFIGQN